MKVYPAVGQLLYLLTALVMTGIHVAKMWRYTASDTYYDSGDTVLSPINYWKYANLIANWGGLSLWGLAALT